MKIGQKIRTIARKANLKVSVAVSEQSVTITLVKGDIPTFLDVCMKKYPKGIMAAEGKSYNFGLGDQWPAAEKTKSVIKVSEVKTERKPIAIPNIKNATEIPAGYDLVVCEKGEDPVTQGLVLYDFTEVGLFADIKKPVYTFIPSAASLVDEKLAKVKATKAPKVKAAPKVKKGDHSKAAENLVNSFDPIISKDLKKEGFKFYHEVTDHTTKTVTYFWDTPRCLRHQDEVSNPESKWFKNLLTAYNKFEGDLSKFITGLEKLGYKFDSHA